MYRRMVGLALLLGILGAPAVLSAQVTSGTVKLGLDTTLFDLSTGEWNPDGAPAWDYQKIQVGLEPNVGLGLGYVVAEGVVLGARLQLGWDREKSDDGGFKESTLGWGVLPYVEVAFLSQVVRPFITLALGFEGEKVWVHGATTNLWAFTLGAGGGVHFFATPSVSIDTSLLLGFAAGRGELAETTDIKQILFRMSTLLGVSAWF